MLRQTEIDFSRYDHGQENNKFSDDHYTDHLEKFNGQCAKVLKLLREGERLTVYDAVLIHGITSLPRRVLDCNNYFLSQGLPAPIKSEWAYKEGKRDHKVYFIDK